MPREALCDICGEKSFKYRCPACGKQTCSLPCVNKHKEVAQCSGVRSKTNYVALKDFSDMNLLSDYRMLEETNRVADSATRDTLKKFHGRPKHVRPSFLGLNVKANFIPKVKRMVCEARKRNITLKVMPYPMSKRVSNKSSYQYKNKIFLWHIEWIFPSAEAKHVTLTKEDLLLSHALKEVLNPSTGDPVILHRLKSYVKTPVSHLSLLMKMEGEVSKTPRYYKLDHTKSLSENLSGKTVIEYPSILVVLPTECDKYTLVPTTTELCQTSTVPPEPVSVAEHTPVICNTSVPGNIIGGIKETGIVGADCDSYDASVNMPAAVCSEGEVCLRHDEQENHDISKTAVSIGTANIINCT